MNLRLLAAKVINQVTEGRSLADCLDPTLNQIKDARDKAFVQALCYGVCRFYIRLDVVLSYLLDKPMKAKDSDIHALLLVGLYQLMEMRVPAHAAVAETVNAAAKLKKSWARGFVNAILREFLREQAAIEQKALTDEEALYAHPMWWINALKAAWPAHWQAILTANNAHPPLALRVNQQHISRADYLEQLQKHDLVATVIPYTAHGVILNTPIPVENVPGFFNGDVSVQDGAAQLAAELLSVLPGANVLDACAAPGGKLSHLLEGEKTLIVTAVEKDPQRMRSIQENLTRLKLSAKCVCADAKEVATWWDGSAFDAILLDAPCSASGVIRRHPDIKLLREPRDIPALAQEQAALLENLWPLLKPGGTLLYVTCSVFPEENCFVVEQFLASHLDAEEDVITAEWGQTCAVGKQILPGMHEMDGFYYAKLKKQL